MFIEECESLKIIENKMKFKFSELELIGYVHMYFDIGIYEYNEKIYVLDFYENKIISIYEICNGKSTIGISYNGKNYIFKYKRRICIYRNIIEIQNNSKKEVIKTNDKILKITNEEAIIFKLCEQFLNEEKILKSKYIIKE